ncbi:MAG: condensation domain-containing protein [Jatrophihabitantaceae bacterium]
MFVQPVESRFTVPFSGTVSGAAPLTWGQKAILQDMRENVFTLNASGAHALAEGATVESVAAQLGELISRHPALRVRLATDPQGNIGQEVAGSGEAAVEVMDFADDDDPADVAKYTDQLWYDWLMTRFDHYRDWPIRVGVIRHRGLTLYRVVTFNHLVVDGTAIKVLMSELRADEPVPASGDGVLQIMELAEREQTPQARKVSDRAMRYWETHLRDIPPRTFGEPIHSEGRLGKRYWHARFGSPATYLAVLAIAQRSGMDTSRVLFGIIATAVGRATGLSTLTAKVITSNRFRPGLAEVIAPLSQNSLVSVDLADATVDEVLARGRRALLAGGMHAYYDPDQLTELMARLDSERGYQAQLSCRINDRRMTTRRATDEEARAARVTPEQIQEKLAETWFSWDGTLDHLHEQAFITVEDYRDTVYLQLIFDMACLTEEQVENFAHGVEQVAVAAAFDPEAPAGIPAPLDATATPDLAVPQSYRDWVPERVDPCLEVGGS